MRRYLFIPTTVLAGTLALGCGDPSGVTDPPPDGPAFTAAEEITNVVTVPVDFELSICTEEVVHWTGTLQIVDHITANRGFPLDPNNIQHIVSLQTLRVTGVGETSGGTYLVRGTFNNSQQSPSPTDPFPATLTITNRDRVFGPDGGLLGISMFSVKLVINGSGDLVVLDVDAQCL
jgi:hypothetical protein